MNESDDKIKLEEDEKFEEKEYLSKNIPKNISDLIEPERHIIEKDAKLSWDGRQLMVRMPLDITDEMGIYKDNKSDFRVHFELVKPTPDSDEEKTVTIQLIKL